MTISESLYRELRAAPSDARWQWLQERAPVEMRGHWWLSLIERAAFDASHAREGRISSARSDLDFVVELIELAERDGMPPHYAASRLALVAAGLLNSGESLKTASLALQPDVLARRILSSFRLSPDRAVGIARQLREEGLIPGHVADEDLRDLHDLKWLLPDLVMLKPHVVDEGLLSVLDEWIELVQDLEE